MKNTRLLSMLDKMNQLEQNADTQEEFQLVTPNYANTIAGGIGPVGGELTGEETFAGDCNTNWSGTCGTAWTGSCKGIWN